ncbi:unnamed protein product [Pleuronectes platessa]|uniref:Uncharacterized protein n=1 Tax=Pleuronectes platessa TaxID=8262 RepID=A0A9N7TM80_PLEPL|nr:unnamed protein product [Pleuronectes platessa]
MEAGTDLIGLITLHRLVETQPRVVYVRGDTQDGGAWSRVSVSPSTCGSTVSMKDDPSVAQIKHMKE